MTRFIRLILVGCCLAFWAMPALGTPLEQDRKKHGPLDGHPVLVYELLQKMDLPEETLSSCREVASKAQADWRAWYSQNHEKVLEFVGRIRTLKEKGDRKELARIRKEKKAFMHTAPSLLRKPEPLKAVLSEKQYADFFLQLDKLRKDLHQPKRKAKTDKSKEKLHNEGLLAN